MKKIVTIMINAIAFNLLYLKFGWIAEEIWNESVKSIPQINLLKMVSWGRFKNQLEREENII